MAIILIQQNYRSYKKNFIIHPHFYANFQVFQRLEVYSNNFIVATKSIILYLNLSLIETLQSISHPKQVLNLYSIIHLNVFHLFLIFHL